MADRKISDLTALTTPATGDLIPIVDVSEAAAADKNKSITVGELLRGAPDGTAAAPGIAFESDGGNGIFLAGTDQVGVATGGVERVEFGASEVVFNDGGADYDFRIEGDTNTALFFVDASTDRVGVGTTSPGAKLEISANNNGATQNNVLRFTDTDGSFSAGQSPGRIEWNTSDADSPGTTAFIDTYGYTNAVSDLLFGTGAGGSATERMRIKHDGKVGIGTSSPAHLLHVKGTDDSDSGDVTVRVDAGTVSSASATNNAVLDLTARGQTSGGAARTQNCEIRSLGRDDAGGTLTFHTDDTSAVLRERMRIDSAGHVKIGNSTTVTPNSNANTFVIDEGAADTGLSILSTTTGRIYFGDASNDDAGSIRYVHTDNSMRFETDDEEALRIDSSGRLLVGTSTARSTFGTNQTIQFQLEGTDFPTSSAGLVRNSNNSGAPALTLAKTRGTAVGSHTIVQNNDDLGALRFEGADGSKLIEGARIIAEVDGTPGANDMPGRLVFSTTADGASSPTERMRIASNGKFTAPTIYSITTTGGGPVYVESDGDLLRYTSSLKYKTDVETIEDARADAILNCRPVWYRSKCENDIKTEGSEKSDWGWYGFIAEEVAEIEPRLVNWATKDAVEQDDGSVKSVEREPANYEAEGVRYDNFVPLLLNLIKRQKEQIEAMETRLAALEAN